METRPGRRDREVVVIFQRRRQRTTQFAVAVVVFLLGMAASLAAQPTTSGRVTAVIFFLLLIALVTWLWLFLNRRRDRIEVTCDAISRRRWNGDVEATLSRPQDGDVRLIPRVRARGISEPARLAIAGSGEDMSLSGFAPPAVIRACETGGWRVGRESTG